MSPRTPLPREVIATINRMPTRPKSAPDAPTLRPLLAWNCRLTADAITPASR
jgi:hypothetical protein